MAGPFPISQSVTEERPQGLWPAEQKLLEHVRKGEPCEIGKERPTECTDENRIDAAFLRFLLLGGDETAPVHETGMDTGRGAYIFRDIDLINCYDIVGRLGCSKCYISGELIGRHAQFVVPLSLELAVLSTA